MSHYSENRSPEWEKKNGKWIYAWHHYTGEYADEENIGDYLHRKEQAETLKAYDERLFTSDISLHFGSLIDSLCGVMFSKESDAKRSFGILGEYDENGELDKDSIAYKISHNSDGKGTNWVPMMKKTAITQTVLHTVWGLVEGVEVDEDGNTISEACVKHILPQHVVNQFPSNGNPTSVLVKEKRDNRNGITTSLHDDEDTYTLYELDGWTRFRVATNQNGEQVEEVLGQGDYRYYADAEKRIPCLPIFRVDIPMPRMVGYLLARKNNYIFNYKSIRDFAVRNMAFAFLQVVADQSQYDQLLDDLDKGFRILRKDPDAHGEHGYKSPDSSYLTEAGRIYEKDVEAFYKDGFKEYGRAAQRTATEVHLESQSGIQAFLALLVSSVDEFENNALWLINQVYYPERPTEWAESYVMRSRNFQIEDIHEAFKKMVESILTADRAGAISMYQKIKDIRPNWTDEQIDKEIERINRENGLPDRDASDLI